MPEPFEVRLSRWTVLMFLGVGVLFFLVGLGFVLLNCLGGSGIGQEKPAVFWAFNIVAISVGLAIAVNCTYYMIAPPVLMRISEEGIAFGIGLRYVQRMVPLEHLVSVERYTTESRLRLLGRTRIVEGGVELHFEEGEGVPIGMATSAGISYCDRCLRLSRTHMNRSVQETVDAVNKFIEQRRS